MQPLPVLMVYGADHVAHIRNVAIPALAAQAGAPPLELHLVNYANNQPLLGGKDHSAARANQRIGFGEGINFLFEQAQPLEHFIILNPDTIPDRHCIARLLESYRSGQTGIVEARQWPSEHPKTYDRGNGQTAWASGACALIDSAFFRQSGGFDPIYFMYCEDVDLSWKAWLAGREVIYAPRAGIMHFTGLLHYQTDRYYYEHFYSARNFLVISRKFFGEKGEKRAIKLLGSTGYPKAFRQLVLDEYAKIKPRIHEVAGAEKQAQIQILGFNCYHRMRGHV